ncbi:MAG: PEP-CTERM sorting domain-containing protein [Verrucomicrobiales bacterium]
MKNKSTLGLLSALFISLSSLASASVSFLERDGDLDIVIHSPISFEITSGIGTLDFGILFQNVYDEAQPNNARDTTGSTVAEISGSVNQQATSHNVISGTLHTWSTAISDRDLVVMWRLSDSALLYEIGDVVTFGEGTRTIVGFFDNWGEHPDLTSGSVSSALIGLNGFVVSDYQNLNVIPEPATALLSGLVVMTALIRRQRCQIS